MFIEVKDNESEKFNESKCLCEFCLSIHQSNKDWNTYTPKTNLQKKMKKVVSKLSQ